jgi:hypothetical protein
MSVRCFDSHAALVGLLLGVWLGWCVVGVVWLGVCGVLWLSVAGLMVDALVPGADEGRGRPR